MTHLTSTDQNPGPNSSSMALVTLLAMAHVINGDWEDRESVDWQQAEDFVAALRDMCLVGKPIVAAIVDYADSNDDWDSGYVASWPELVIDCFES